MYARVNGIRTHYLVNGPANAPWVTFVTGIANDVATVGGPSPRDAGYNARLPEFLA